MKRWLAGLRTFVALVLLSLGALIGCQLVFGDVEIGKPKPVGTATAPGTCTDGFQCFQELLIKCSRDEDSANAIQTCQSPNLCDSKGGTCRCNTGERRCSPQGDGEHYQACSPAGKFEDTGLVCPPGQCGPTGCSCEEGEIQCKGKQLLRCGKGNQWEPVQDCVSAALCEKGLEAARRDPSQPLKCGEPGCPTPNAYYCFDTELKRCDENQTGWMPVDTCATASVCESTKALAQRMQQGSVKACIEECHVPGSFKCSGTTGTTVELCDPELRSWAPTGTTCPAGTCNPAQGDCSLPAACEPGKYQCNDVVLRRCTQAQTWEDVGTALHPALCDAEAGVIHEPHCYAGTYDCQADSNNPLSTEKSVLVKCSADFKQWVIDTPCKSAALCNARDGKCDPEVCIPGAFFCNGQELSQCKPDASGYVTVKSCEGLTFCDANAGDCKNYCSAERACNGKELQTCTAAEGWKPKAICLSEALCKCAVEGTCTAGSDGCGLPVCADNEYQCGGPEKREVLKCAASRAGWEGSNWICDSAELCDPGNLATNTPGACLACTTPGERRCDGLTLKVCSNDRRNWNTQQNCNSKYGCQDNGANDYCPTCNTGDRWCEGAQPRVCNSSRTGGVNDGGACASAELCVSNNLSQGRKCKQCNAGELKCEGAQRMVCNAEEDGWRNDGPACDSAALCEMGRASRECPKPPECDPGETRCAPMNVLEKCNSTRTGWVQTPCEAPEPYCVNGSCKQCTGSEPATCVMGRVRSCTNNTWTERSCEASKVCEDGRCVDPPAPECDPPGTARCPTETSRQVCTADQTWGQATSCSGSTPYCFGGECKQCQGTEAPTCDENRIKTCNATTHAWAYQACATGETCQGGQCVTPPECTPTARECNTSGDSYRVCSAGGTWSNYTQCAATTPYCFGGECKECQGTEAPTCDQNRIKTCNATTHAWSYQGCATGETCAGGQCVTPPECTPAARQCVAETNQYRVCDENGHWGAPLSCGDQVCQAGECVPPPAPAP